MNPISDAGQAPKRWHHALLVGGTGMLRGVALHLAGRCQHLTVIARTQQKLDSLGEEIQRADSRYLPITVDYHDTSTLKRSLNQAIRNGGSIDLCVAWIHKTAADAPRVIAEVVGGGDGTSPADFLHVLGSLEDEWDPVKIRWREQLAAMPGIRYRIAWLGHVQTGDTRRWLTDHEIIAGVIHAIHSPARGITIGKLDRMPPVPAGYESLVAAPMQVDK